MREELIQILEDYPNQKEREFSGNDLAFYILREARDAVANALPSDLRSAFKINASAGQGTWAEVPWIGIFDREITESAIHGYYIVYLFSANMSAEYLSTNQRWTFFRDTFGPRMAREKISIAATALRRMLADIDDMVEERIDLASGRELGV